MGALPEKENKIYPLISCRMFQIQKFIKMFLLNTFDSVYIYFQSVHYAIHLLLVIHAVSCTRLDFAAESNHTLKLRGWERVLCCNSIYLVKSQPGHTPGA